MLMSNVLGAEGIHIYTTQAPHSEFINSDNVGEIEFDMSKQMYRIESARSYDLTDTYGRS